ncbi:MAG: PIG-L family deacetylase [Taibaiella sp.]|nr:PIG-L family deacetylase [Taibaiella sp.]
MRKNFTLALLVLASAMTANGQQVRPANSGTIYHELRQLNNLVSVLYVAAHPDDENTRLLAYMVNDKHIRTAYLSLTRGDGGQNLLGSEQGEALGLIRTHELMEARKIDGAEQFFTRAVDFGFSKSYEETFKHWPKAVLADDAIRVIRRFRPDVVICRFPPDTNAGHGQHAASAIIAEMAFNDAGNKTQYTDHFKYYDAWQPKRLLFNSFRFGSRNTTSEDQFKMQVGQFVPTLGMGVGELAGQSRSVHKSQGAGTPSVPGVQTEYFKLVAGEPFKSSIFEGIETTWKRVGRPDIGDSVASLIARYDFNRPDLLLPSLFRVRRMIAEVKDPYWRSLKTEEINRLIQHCAGVMVEVTTKQPVAAKGELVPFTAKIIARSATPIILRKIGWRNGDTTMDVRLGFDSLVTLEHLEIIRANEKVTQPYWLEFNANNDLYYMPLDTAAGLPETPNGLVVPITLLVGGETMTIDVPLSYKRLDPVKGDVVEQLRIVPDLTIEFTDKIIVAKEDGSCKISARLHAYADLNGLNLRMASDKSGVLLEAFITMKKGADSLLTFSVPAGRGPSAERDMYVVPVAGVPDMGTLNLIQYDHLPTLQYFSKPFTRVIAPSWKSTARKIGYLEGAGDKVAEVLRQAGLEVDVLKPEDLASADRLMKYDAILTGVRVANAEKRMALWMPVLLKYAENGGTLVMQYNTAHELATKKLGPYPFDLSTKRVTEEDAEMTITKPTHRLLNYPNKIEKADFDGWVQERGLYFASKWDDKYTTLFSAHDTGEEPLNGSTLYAQVGKGHYVYTSLSFFRQLPAANKGAIKLLMNMLSVGK